MVRTTQTAWYYINGRLASTELPCPRSELASGILWGEFEEFFTPAFWRVQAEIEIRQGRYVSHRLGETLIEEAAACLLGGYGIPAEMGVAAFLRLRGLGLLTGEVRRGDLQEALAQPFEFNGKTRCYRFAKQKAEYLARLLRSLSGSNVPHDDLELRSMLLGLPGIGPKTASWIVRNYANSNRVAILDVHILRAGRILGLFNERDDPTKNYFDMEHRYLEFCVDIEVPAAFLDALMWDYMRRVGPTARRSSFAWQPLSPRVTELSLG
jgi:thermostable 8-oxoguanine DNA glycosylase